MNRLYFLIAKKKAVDHVNHLTLNDQIDLSKAIFIDVPKDLTEKASKNLDIPRKPMEKSEKSKTYENRVKRLLPSVDLFIFAHSEMGGEEEFRKYLNENLSYKIPEDYEFWIMYRSKDPMEPDTSFRFLEPIYGNNHTITAFLEDLAKEEYQNRLQTEEKRSYLMTQNATWKKLYQDVIMPDIKNKGTVLEHFENWLDTRGNRKKFQVVTSRRKLQEFKDTIQEAELRGIEYPISLSSMRKYSLAVIMQSCRIFKDNPYVWDSLKRRLGSYKEIRGYLLCRNDYKNEQLKKGYEFELRDAVVEKNKINFLTHDCSGIFPGDYLRYYDLLVFTSYTIEELKKEGLYPENLNAYPEEIQKSVEEKLKTKYQKMEVEKTKETEVKPATMIFEQDGIKKEKPVYVEEEEFLTEEEQENMNPQPKDYTSIEMYYEDMKPEEKLLKKTK